MIDCIASLLTILILGASVVTLLRAIAADEKRKGSK